MGYKYEQQLTPVVTGFECDMCGESFDGAALMESVGIDHTFGYESGHDQANVEAVLCEPCYFNMLRSALPAHCFKE